MNSAILGGVGLGLVNIPSDHELYDPTVGPQRAIGAGGMVAPYFGGRLGPYLGAELGLLAGAASETTLLGGGFQFTAGMPLNDLGIKLGLDTLRPYVGVGMSLLASRTTDIGNDSDQGSHLALGLDAPFYQSPFGVRVEARQATLPALGPEAAPSLPLQLTAAFTWRRERVDPKVAMKRDLAALFGGLEDAPDTSELKSLKSDKVNMGEVLTEMATDGTLAPSAAGRAVSSMATLAEEEPEVEAFLTETLTSPDIDPYLRRKSMYALVEAKGDAFVDEAAELLKNDPDPQMRQAALNALEVLDSEVAEEALEEVPGVLVTVDTPVGQDEDLRLVVTHPDGRQSVHHHDVDLYDYTFGDGEWLVEARQGPCLTGKGTIRSDAARSELAVEMQPVWPGTVALDVRDARGFPITAVVTFEPEIKGCAPDSIEATGLVQQPVGFGNHVVVVEAEGYAPLRSEILVDSEEPVTLTAALQPTNVEVVDGGLTTTEITFSSGSAILTRDSGKVLDEVASILDIQTTDVIIEGHTDDRGADERNLALSQQRAEAVLQGLVKRGVDNERLRAQGFGETRPVEDNGTAAGRAKNRRVDFVFTKFDDVAPGAAPQPEGVAPQPEAPEVAPEDAVPQLEDSSQQSAPPESPAPDVPEPDPPAEEAGDATNAPEEILEDEGGAFLR